MAYQIEYYSVKKVRGLEKRVSLVTALIGLCFLVFCVLAFFIWPDGVNFIRNFFSPGDPHVTAAAFDDLTLQLREGKSLQQAFYSFCVQILDGAKLDSRY